MGKKSDEILAIKSEINGILDGHYKAALKDEEDPSSTTIDSGLRPMDDPNPPGGDRPPTAPPVG